MSRFIPVNRHQQYLPPPSVDEWLPDNHLAPLHRRSHRPTGHKPADKLLSRPRFDSVHPSVLLALPVGYATGVFSSRKIERVTYDSVAFRFLSADAHPDHDTLAHFRKTFLIEPEDFSSRY